VYKVEVYGRVRRAVQVDGMSVRQAAREFELSRQSVRKMLTFAAPPGYQQKEPVKRPKLGPWGGVIDAILEDEGQPKKQRPDIPVFGAAGSGRWSRGLRGPDGRQ
jgi:hypothetical protein